MTEKLLRVAFVFIDNFTHNWRWCIVVELSRSTIWRWADEKVWHQAQRTFDQAMRDYKNGGVLIEYPEERSAAIAQPTSSDDWESAFRRNRDRMMARMFK